MLPIKNGLMSVKAGMNKDQTIGDTFKSLAQFMLLKKDNIARRNKTFWQGKG